MLLKPFEYIFIIFFLFANLSSGFAIPKEEARKIKTPDQRLSDEEHYTKNDHNTAYDHEAFLGEDEAHSFDTLTPEESKRRLNSIFTKIDVNKDDLISQEELRMWIHTSQKNFIMENIDRQWKTHNPENENEISWDKYQKETYGFVGNNNLSVEEDVKQYIDLIKRDKKRWELADKDGNLLLTKDEFGNFLHPEEANHMKDLVVEETLQDLDTNKDGKLSIEEFISDMSSDLDLNDLPDWLIAEKEQFTGVRDKNKDGFMDKEEIKDWILPQDYDQSSAEATHLITESDENKDGLLSREEVLNNYDLFVGSQATDYGEALLKHDEF